MVVASPSGPLHAHARAVALICGRDGLFVCHDQTIIMIEIASARPRCLTWIVTVRAVASVTQRGGLTHRNSRFSMDASTNPTPQDAARKILSVFADERLSLGGTLSLWQLEGAFLMDLRFRIPNYFHGLDYATANTWVRYTDHNSIELLAPGYLEMKRMRHSPEQSNRV